MPAAVAMPAPMVKAHSFAAEPPASPTTPSRRSVKPERRLTTPDVSTDRPPRTPNPNRGHFQPYPTSVPSSPESPRASTSRRTATENNQVLPDQPHDNDPDAEFIHPPYAPKLNYMSIVSASGPSKFLDAQDFIKDGEVLQEYSFCLEPVRGIGGLKSAPLADDDCLRCTFCRKKYHGKNAKSMWRRHVQKAHKIKLKNYKDRAHESETFERNRLSTLQRKDSRECDTLPAPLPYPPPPTHLERISIARLPLISNLAPNASKAIQYGLPLLKPAAFGDQSILPPLGTKTVKPSSKTSKENTTREGTLGSLKMKKLLPRLAPLAAANEAIPKVPVALSTISPTSPVSIVPRLPEVELQSSPRHCHHLWTSAVPCAYCYNEANGAPSSDSTRQSTMVSPSKETSSSGMTPKSSYDIIPFYTPPALHASLMPSHSPHSFEYADPCIVDSEHSDSSSGDIMPSTSQLSAFYGSGDESGDEWFTSSSGSDGEYAIGPVMFHSSPRLSGPIGLGFNVDIALSSRITVSAPYDMESEEVDVDQWLRFDDAEDDTVSTLLAVA
ncbi:hypothetical protein BKA62DRAFT_227719 [Auriculariales sp. MPI-PUGE-AT-0066]|nr:hypothetical protein BKA62DRAFT_227719 [Auriculariales sp. MPI-PUGE-AT-0066]